MARNGFKAMDSDMHVIEPLDLWQRYTEPDFKDRAPRGLERWMGDMQIELEGCLMPTEPEDWATDKAQEQDDTYRHSHENGWDPASQVRAMDLEGLDIAFLYPSRELFALAFDKLDPALGAAISRAYNQWMHDFCSYAPNRLFGAAMISPFDAESAAVEARRAAKDLELKAVFIRPNVVNERNWHDPYYDPLWAEIESLGIPLGFHEGSNTKMNQVGSRFSTLMMLHTCCHPMEMMLSVVDMIGGGVLERFPKLQVGFLEGNCAWAPWLLWRLNEHFEMSGRFESPNLRLEPTDYFKRQAYVSVEPDEEPATLLEEVGLEHIMVFSTDYPHNDAKYPHAIETFLTMPFSEETKRKVL